VKANSTLNESTPDKQAWLFGFPEPLMSKKQLSDLTQQQAGPCFRFTSSGNWHLLGKPLCLMLGMQNQICLRYKVC